MEDRFMNVSVLFITSYTDLLLDVSIYRPKLTLYRVKRDISLEFLIKRLQLSVDKCIELLVYVDGGQDYIVIDSDAVLLKAIKGCDKELHLYLIVDPKRPFNNNPTETNTCNNSRTMNNQNSDKDLMKNSSQDCSGSTFTKFEHLRVYHCNGGGGRQMCSVCEQEAAYFRYICCTCLEHFCNDCLPRTPHYTNNHPVILMKGVIQHSAPVSPKIFSLLGWNGSGHQDSVETAAVSACGGCETAVGNEVVLGDKISNGGVSSEVKKNPTASLEVDNGALESMIKRFETFGSDVESVASDKDNYDCLDDFVIVPMPDCFDVNLPSSKTCSKILYISRDDISTTNNEGYVVENIMEFVGSQQEEIDTQQQQQQQIDTQQQQIDTQQQQIDTQQQKIYSEQQIDIPKEQIEMQQLKVDSHQHQQNEVQQAQQQQHSAQQNQQNETNKHIRDSDDDISEQFEECLQNEYEHYHLNQQQNEPKIHDVPEQQQQQQKCFNEIEIQHQLFDGIEPQLLVELEQLYEKHSIDELQQQQQQQLDGEDVTCDSEIAFLRQIDEIEYHENQTKRSIPLNQASNNIADPFSNGDEDEASPLQLVADVVNTASKMASKAANKAFDAMKQAYQSLQILPSTPGVSRSPSCFGNLSGSNNTNYNNNNNNNGHRNNNSSVNGKSYYGNNLSRSDSLTTFNVDGVNFSNINVNNNTTGYGYDGDEPNFYNNNYNNNNNARNVPSSEQINRSSPPAHLCNPSNNDSSVPGTASSAAAADRAWIPKPTDWVPKPTDWTLKKADWTPPEENWVPKPAACSGAHSPAPTSSSSRDVDTMNLLIEMGFANRRVNSRLVKMFNGDMDLILNDITSNGYVDRTCPGMWDLD